MYRRVVRVPSPALGEDVTVLLQRVGTPSDVAVAESARWLWLLHGRGSSAAETAPVVDSLAVASTAGRLAPMVVAVVDGPWRGGAHWWVDSDVDGTGSPGLPVETAVLRDVLPEVERRHGAASGPAGRTVAGISMGGAAALRYALAYPRLFGSALLLSPSVYDVPPPESSARTSGAFGRGAEVFDEARWHATMSYAGPLVRGAGAVGGGTGAPTRVVTIVGDDEPPQPGLDGGPADLTLQAARLHAALRREPHLHSSFRVVAGGHDWPTWQRAAPEGMRLIEQSSR